MQQAFYGSPPACPVLGSFHQATMLPVQATARTYEEALEEAVDVAEEKLLSGRQTLQDAGDRDAEELQRKELQAWDDRFERDSDKERDSQ